MTKDINNPNRSSRKIIKVINNVQYTLNEIFDGGFNED
jgi:hypothetical protein